MIALNRFPRGMLVSAAGRPVGRPARPGGPILIGILLGLACLGTVFWYVIH